MIEFLALAAECAPHVHPDTMTAIVRHESGFNPLAINVNAKGVMLTAQPKTKPEAVTKAQDLIRAGYSIDMGYGQINSNNLGWLGLSVEEVFDPCTNLKAAQTVLSDCYARALREQLRPSAALGAALSCYNTGNFKSGFNNGYVTTVATKAGVQVPAIQTLGEGRENETDGVPSSVSTPAFPNGTSGDVFTGKRDQFTDQAPEKK